MKSNYPWLYFFMFISIYAMIAGLVYGIIQLSEYSTIYIGDIPFSIEFFLYILFITPIFIIFIQNKLKLPNENRKRC